MKTTKSIATSILFMAFVGSLYCCKKDFLNEKPSTDIVHPSTLNNMIGLLENPVFMSSSPALPTLSADEYEYKNYDTYNSVRTATERNAHIWASDLYVDQTDVLDWSLPYKCVFYANTVLKGLEEIPLTSENAEKYKFAKGWAHFNRAYNFYLLTSNFCRNYNLETSENDLGIPLKLSPNIDVIMQRSSLKDTYSQIFKDLSIARQLLAQQRLPNEKRNQPSLSAVYAIQARIYLNMGEYAKAELSSDSCLNLYGNLIDYNSIQLPNSKPFSATNEESIYATSQVNTYGAGIVTSGNTSITISQTLLNLYEPNDLRAGIFFLNISGRFVMNQTYMGRTLYPFTGLATDEIYLIKAECLARRGLAEDSMRVLNKLLIKRFAPLNFIPKQAKNRQEAIDIVLTERRKELIWRGIRWQDLKRLNKEGANITLSRLLKGITYTLLPNDAKYVFPIPSNEIALSGIIQNIR